MFYSLQKKLRQKLLIFTVFLLSSPFFFCSDSPYVIPHKTETVEPPVIYSLYSTLYANEQWQVYGSGSYYFSSEDSTNWKRINLNDSFYIEKVIYSNEAYWAVGAEGFLASSTDGLNWQSVSVSDNFSAWLFDIEASGDTLIAVGSGATVLLSNDKGQSWSEQSLGSSGEIIKALSVRSSPGVLYVVSTWEGSIYTSANGTSWTQISLSESVYINDIAYDEDNSLFIGVGQEGKIITSSDGSTFTVRESSTSNNLNALTVGKDRDGNVLYIAVGESGTIVSSSDTLNWTTLSSKTSEDLYTVSFAQDTFLAAGHDLEIISSTDGVSWKVVHSN